MMDVAVPANMRQGLMQAEIARLGWAVTAAEAVGLLGTRDVELIDLRERSERDKHGQIAGSRHVPYPELQQSIGVGGVLHELATTMGKRLLFYCAFGERSAMAVQAARDAGLSNACHIDGGMAAWTNLRSLRHAPSPARSSDGAQRGGPRYSSPTER